MKFLGLTTLLLLGCQTPKAPIEKQEPASRMSIVADTVVEKKDTEKKLSLTSNSKTVQIPSSLLEEGRTRRRAVELREGPGLQYEVLDRLISNHEDLLVLESYGNWRRIYIPKLKLTGWLHKKTIFKTEGIPAIYSLPINKLSTAIATKNVENAYTYPERELIRVDFKKGSQFYVIKHDRRRVLAWIQETNSVAWFSREDLK